MSLVRRRLTSSALRYHVVILVTCIFFSFFGQVQAATIKAKSVSFEDVSSAVASAKDGDTVTIPAGTASWTSALLITKGITLQGAGNDSTVILDDIPREERREARVKRKQPTGPNQRELEQPRRAALRPKSKPGPGSARPRKESKSAVMRIELSRNQSFRMTGFTFRYGSRTSRPAQGACIKITGTCPSVRVDHCHFDQLYQNGLFFAGWIYGVVDHCIFDGRAAAGTIFSMTVYNGLTWGGGTNDHGDGSWAEPAYFGSEKFLFIEDNNFNNLGQVATTPAIDCKMGGRYVARYNTFNNVVMITGHGTESGGRGRSQRAIEIYNNTATATFRQSIGQSRGGTAVYHNNAWKGNYGSNSIAQKVYREFWPFKTFGGANGNNSWDYNATEADGTHVEGHSPHLYAKGTHTGPNASSTLVVAGAGWTPNQWLDYSVTNTTQSASAHNPEHYSSFITANTSDTITFVRESAFGPPMNFNTGDGFAIFKVLIALDQCGRGAGDLLAGQTPINTRTGGIAWPRQALEPVYGWNNAVNGLPVKVSSVAPTIKENRDYYNGPKPDYKPYTYPHPLVRATPPPPSKQN